MALQYNVTPLPAAWPGPKVVARRSPFKTQWTKTLQLLEREIKHLGGSHVEFAVDVRGPRDINQNGTLRADARPANRVIVSFRTRGGKRLQFPCGTFSFWQDNVYAIAKALEALRMVERYGVSSTSQYEGFKALPPRTTTAFNSEQAAQAIGHRAEYRADLILTDREHARAAIRRAAAKAHPDAGGSTDDFQLVQEAKRVLSAHHGVAL